MMKRGVLPLHLFGMIAVILAAAPTAADAQRWGGRDGHGGGWHDHGGRGGGYRERDDDRYYDRGGYYRGGGGRGDYANRHRCRNGADGTIIGAIAGGLLGNVVAGNGDRTTGTIIGGGVGALAGRAMARGC